MKIILTALMLILALSSFGQKIYVHCDDDKSRQLLEEKIRFEGFSTTPDKAGADYILECRVWQTSKINSMYKGDVELLTADGRAVGKSDEVRKGAVAVNGFNASSNIFGVIAKKQLAKMLSAIPKN